MSNYSTERHNKEEKPNYYAILIAEVRYDENLKANEKLMYAEITALSNQNGTCWASNDYFAKLYKVNKKTVSSWVSHLRELGYIDVELIYKPKSKEVDKRIISINKLPSPLKKGYPTPQIMEDNTTSINKNYNVKDDSLKVLFLNAYNILKEEYSEHIANIFYEYAETYENYFDKKHPPIKVEQLNTLADKVDDFMSEFSLDEEDFIGIIETYFTRGSVGDGNINRFLGGNSRDGTIRGLID